MFYKHLNIFIFGCIVQCSSIALCSLNQIACKNTLMEYIVFCIYISSVQCIHQLLLVELTSMVVGVHWSLFPIPISTHQTVGMVLDIQPTSLLVAVTVLYVALALQLWEGNFQLFLTWL